MFSFVNATYSVDGRGMPTLVEFKDGYQVATRSALKVAQFMVPSLSATRILCEVASYSQVNEFIGVWTDLEDGTLYIDLSAHYEDKEDAIRAAKAMGELAIFDWATMSDIRI